MELVSELQVSAALKQTLGELGVQTLTPVQQQTLPLLMQGVDVVAQAQTGSGKTFAFAIPAVEQIDLESRIAQVLVICPTRELCTQVAREIRKVGRHLIGLHVTTLAGGTRIGPQVAALENGAHIIVGTPGRLCDHLKRRSLKLYKIKTVVLDEADRILEMGFVEQVETILNVTPKNRQTVFFSATFPDTIAELSEAFQREAQQVIVEGQEVSAPDIKHSYIQVENRDKYEALLETLQALKPTAAIVFCNMKAFAADVATKLSEHGISSAAIHGDLEQFDRDQVMARFRNRSIRVLVATDVAARGIDVHSLDLVVNYDLPVQPEIYIHRVGRTGRAGLSGVAMSFVSPREGYKIEAIEELLGSSIQKQNGFESQHEIKAEPNESVQSLAQAEMETMRISAGRKDKMRPGDILGALTGEAGGLKGAEVGKIEIYDRYSYVAVASAVARDAYKSLSEGRIKGRRLSVEWVR